MVVAVANKIFRQVFGSRNDRLIKRYHKHVQAVNACEVSVGPLTDAQLRDKTVAFKEQLAQGQTIDDISPMVLAVGREVMDRSVGMRNIFNPDAQFDVSQLPQDLQSLYQQVNEQMLGTEPLEVIGCHALIPGWQQVDVPVEIYQAVRALYPKSRPPFRARPFDVQLIGGMVLSGGTIAEMKTGEGKTIVAPLACYLACVEGLQCYVVTVNDFLVQRDRDWVFPFYYHLGLSVGAIHPMHMQEPLAKKQAYDCNVVYGTNSEFGFDYLRDNMQLSEEEQSQKSRDFCVIDEVDSILIDEARTPLIISGPAHDDAPRYGLADGVASHLMTMQKKWDQANQLFVNAQIKIKGLEGDIRNTRDKAKIPDMRDQIKQLEEQLPQLEQDRDQHIQYYEVEMEKKSAHLTHEGIAQAQKQADIGSFYVGNNMDFPHLLENALRAHVVYQKNKDYVVQNDEVVIVDEFTGRLMIGRQWSDGLHQAVEAKERVKIKQESQTLATVTIQNYFKLFKRLAGMTGTAITESTEFNEIYQLDVVCIPTNAQVIRDDRNDLIYLAIKDKWDAILEEIKHHHDIGRPVLVGTTSVEHSESLSAMLTKKYNIQHEVLNAKVDQVERESHIVEHAGQLGAVMIATNMAGRGTDIRLASIDKQTLVHHWLQRDLLPKQATAQMEDDTLLELAHRHLAQRMLGLSQTQVDQMGHDEIYLSLLKHWVGHQTFITPAKADKLNKDQLAKELDQAGGFLLHRLCIWANVEQMGGLHIVGTERHESRRIDNQLRGRAGRQGDQGSSRFFISIEDDLMQMFAKGFLMKMLPKLGMKEGDCLEHPWVTKAVERAQRKVEERNFEIRKNLLEYDEVMEYQRNAFYGIRQEVIQGLDIQTIIISYIADSVDDACQLYLDRDYVPMQIAEWSRQALDVSIDHSKLRLDDAQSLADQIRAEARGELRQTLEVTLGEYMSDDLPVEQWDLRSLSSWAMSQYKVDLKQNQLRKMDVQQVHTLLTEAAEAQIKKKDLTGLSKFIQANYGQNAMVQWANQKFDLQLKAEDIASEPGEKPAKAKLRIAQQVLDLATKAYQKRELNYPIDFTLELFMSIAQDDTSQAASELLQWSHKRYETDWQATDLDGKTLNDIRQMLVIHALPWVQGDKMQTLVQEAVSKHGDDAAALSQWAEQRLDSSIQEKDLLEDPQARVDQLVQEGKAMLRQELTSLERFVLLQILDMAWKDHLYAMDQLRDSVSARSITDRERDPRVVYKREGALAFEQMQQIVRDRVTDLIFRAKLTPNVQARNVYSGQQQAKHAQAGNVLAGQRQAGGPGGSGGPGSPGSPGSPGGQGTGEQQADLRAAAKAGDQKRPQSRHARRAAAAQSGKEEQPTAVSQKKRPSSSKRRKRKSR